MSKYTKARRDYKKAIMITGGAGFIGSTLTRYFVNKYPEYLIVNYDILDYTSRANTFDDIKDKNNYIFVKGDIRDHELLKNTFEKYSVNGILHMCSLSHVDKSISSPKEFFDTNCIGTVNIYDVARECWGDDYSDKKIFTILTDEIWGQLDVNDPPFTEESPIHGRSPYAASKVCEWFVTQAYTNTYKLPIVAMGCGNAIGPYQHIEKFCPTLMDSLMNHKNIPIYGEGKQMRAWTSTSDIARAIDLLFHKGRSGELYGISGDVCVSNIDMVHLFIKEYSKQTGEKEEELEKLITFIEDPRRSAHDFRYDICHDKITNELGWRSEYTLERSIRETVTWYLEHQEWIERCKNKTYVDWSKEYYNKK